MKLKLVVKHKGKTYWAYRVGKRVNFWSSHKWPFFHGHIDSYDNERVREAFYAWLPFSVLDKREEK